MTWNSSFLVARERFRRARERADESSVSEAELSRAFTAAAVRICIWELLPVCYGLLMIIYFNLSGWYGFGVLFSACLIAPVYAGLKCLGLKIKNEN